MDKPRTTDKACGHGRRTMDKPRTTDKVCGYGRRTSRGQRTRPADDGQAADNGQGLRIRTTDKPRTTDKACGHGQRTSRGQRTRPADDGQAADNGQGLRTRTADDGQAADNGQGLRIRTTDDGQAADNGQSLRTRTADDGQAADNGQGLRTRTADDGQAADNGQGLRTRTADDGQAADNGQGLRTRTADDGQATDNGQGLRTVSGQTMASGQVADVQGQLGTVTWVGGIFVAVVLAVGLTVFFVIDGNEPDIREPTVTIEDGSLRGQWVNSVINDGTKYIAFRWIPYAEPPVGALRFKEPRAPKKWDGYRESTTEGNYCFQSTGGSEDCLYLNVFTPTLPQGSAPELLPVLFLIHGGAFVSGSSSATNYGPDFLVHEDIIVVSVNYRLNAFGFLNFENKGIPGNAALKDLIFALNWVKRNIESFGGDPKKVTIHGQSAGGALTHWLTLLPETEGLFRAAIVLSGNALHGWGFGETNLAFAQEFGRILTGANLTLEEVAEKAKTASPEDLYSASNAAWERTDRKAPASIMMTGFQPSPQRLSAADLGEKPLIVKDSESYLLRRAVPDVPIILGMTNREWVFFKYSGLGSSRLDGVQAQIDNLASLIPQSMIPKRDTQKLLGIEQQAANYKYEDIADYFKKALFQSTTPQCDEECVLSQFEEVAFAGADYTRLARLRARTSGSKNTYLYRFKVISDYNRVFPNETAEERKTAAMHGDDMRYIYYNPSTNQNFNGEGLAPLTLRRMVRMFANFVKTLDPTPQPDSLLPVKWTPYNASVVDADTFLDIGEELTMRQDEYIGGHQDIPVWLQAYQKYREYKSI